MPGTLGIDRYDLLDIVAQPVWSRGRDRKRDGVATSGCVGVGRALFVTLGRCRT